MGAIVFATFSIILKYAGSGVIDIHATCMSIWTLYFGILAIEKDSKYFYLTFPFFVLSMFTRYTAGLIIILIGLYLIFNEKPFDYIKNNIKNIVGGISAWILTTLPFIYYFIVNEIPLRLFDQNNVVLSKTNLAVTALTVKEADYFFYIGHIIKFVSGENPDALLFSHITREIVLLFVFFVFLITIKNFYKESYVTKIKKQIKRGRK